MRNLKKSTEATLIIKSELIDQTHIPYAVFVAVVNFFVLLLLLWIFCD